MTESYASTTNACKLCKPLGASLVFRGIEGCVPFLHGSQGCATYMRRYIISHYNESIDIASSSLAEKHAVYGGGPNLKLGLNNVIAKYHPQVIGIATTCLTETIGDDVPHLLKEYMAEFGNENTPNIVQVSTPSYAGSHMEGFHAAVKSIVMQLTTKVEKNDTINLLPGFVSSEDIRHLRNICEYFGIEATILPDISETLDGPAFDEYPLIPKGGTPLSKIKAMGGARATIEFGATMHQEAAGNYMEDTYEIPLHRMAHPIGIRQTDAFYNALSEISGRPIPQKFTESRGRLVDAMVDGHKHTFGVKTVVYGEEDLVVAMTAFLAEIGVRPVLCASGGKSGRFRNAIETAIKGMGCPMPEVYEDVDFFDIEEKVEQMDVDLLVGHSKGYLFSRRSRIPLVRIGFPIHDRLGGQRILHLGYEGALRLFDMVANTIIANKQDSSEVGYTYM